MVSYCILVVSSCIFRIQYVFSRCVRDTSGIHPGYIQDTSRIHPKRTENTHSQDTFRIQPLCIEDTPRIHPRHTEDVFSGCSQDRCGGCMRVHGICATPGAPQVGLHLRFLGGARRPTGWRLRRKKQHQIKKSTQPRAAPCA